MGHMLEHTEIDALMRFRRMRGANVLWLPGTDHAGIATQMIVERELGRERLPNLPPDPDTEITRRREGQKAREAMGREKFVKRCWQWKEESGGTILKQMVRLGASCDWSRERFTMDPPYSKAVVEAFVRLHRDGLIYRGSYMTNTCPRCATVVSDLEVVHEERQTKLWTIRYPVAEGSGHLSVATTRPETMLGDTAVAVHPDDPRYRDFVGKKVILPLMNRAIPVVADQFVDPKFGTGAVKVTPAHDPNDFRIGERHHLPQVQVIGTDGLMSEEAGAYAGLERFEARKRVLKDLSEQGLLEKTQSYTHSLGTCQRCRTVLEPLVSTQWFIRTAPLAEPAIRVVEEGRIRFVPENYTKIYFDWMHNIHDWCISRQLWWGHRIPAWHCDGCGEVHVGHEAPPACPRCSRSELRPETDVLDTWFSSGLWPFATMGWPEKTPDLERFYPTDLLVTGYDILFFWVARMIMMGMKFMNDVPFRHVYVHALVRDAERQKMSKTKGNVMDPLEVTDRYGTDAVRFALLGSAAPGTDITFSKQKIESNRAFANKIWNAGRFILMNLEKLSAAHRKQLEAALEPLPELGYDAAKTEGDLALADRWIFSRLASLTSETGEALENYRFHEAAHGNYHFFWHEFCDWYLEWVKPEIVKASEGERVSPSWVNLLRVFDASLHLLHPFMPFITEELWHELPGSRGSDSLALSPLEMVRPRVEDRVSENRMESLQELIVSIRNAQAEMGVPARARPSARVGSENAKLVQLFRSHQATVARLARLQALNFVRGRLTSEQGEIRATSQFEVQILFEQQVDKTSERNRLNKEKEKLEGELRQVKGQLANNQFRERAPRQVVEAAEKKHSDCESKYRKVVETLERLG